MSFLPILTLLLLLPTLGVRAEENTKTAEKGKPTAKEAETTAEEAIASLTDPKKLATLKGWKSTNSRFQRCLYWLHKAVIKDVREIDEVLNEAEKRNETDGTKYAVWLSATLSNSFEEAVDFGLFTDEGLKELRVGNCATITKGEYAGQEATADHIIPRSVCPKLENQIFNLRLCPAKVNSKKGDKVEDYSLRFAKLLHRDGLLSQDGFDAVKSAYDKDNPMFHSSSYSITPPANKYTIQPKGEDEVRAYMERDFPLPSTNPAK